MIRSAPRLNSILIRCTECRRPHPGTRPMCAPCKRAARRAAERASLLRHNRTAAGLPTMRDY